MDWTRSKSAGDRTRPAHKFARLNDFTGLSALLRNFFAALLACSDAPKDEDARPARPFRFGPGRSRKTATTKRSFRQAKRNVSRGMS
jgi:hypothetical protein